MAATLTWLDLTASDRDRMRQVLDLFKEQGTVDEMGLGRLVAFEPARPAACGVPVIVSPQNGKADGGPAASVDMDVVATHFVFWNTLLSTASSPGGTRS